MITEAIILAGGLGTRLKSEVPDLPKCMAPIGEVPFISFVINHLQQQGIQHFIFSLGYKSNIVIDYINASYPTMHKTFVTEDEPLGTGGAIKLACSKVERNDAVIVNGDSLFEINIQQFNKAHTQHKAACTLAVKKMIEFDRYGAVLFNEDDGSIFSFKEKEFCKEGYINGGVYILNTKSFLGKTNGLTTFSFEQDYLSKYVAEKCFYAKSFDNYFIDIGIPTDYKKFITKVQNEKPTFK